MSLPIYLLPHEKEIIDELKIQGADEETIKAVTFDFRGKKRELELLNYLKENRNNKISFNQLIAKKMEIKNKYDQFWGYIIEHDSNYFPEYHEEYNPEEYLIQQEKN